MLVAAAAGGPAPGASEQSGDRFSVLSWEQLQRLDQILGEAVPIHGRGNFPTLSVRPRTIVQVRPGRGEAGRPQVGRGEAWRGGGKAGVEGGWGGYRPRSAAPLDSAPFPWGSGRK